MSTEKIILLKSYNTDFKENISAWSQFLQIEARYKNETVSHQKSLCHQEYTTLKIGEKITPNNSRVLFCDSYKNTCNYNLLDENHACVGQTVISITRNRI